MAFQLKSSFKYFPRKPLGLALFNSIFAMLQICIFFLFSHIIQEMKFRILLLGLLLSLVKAFSLAADITQSGPAFYPAKDSALIGGFLLDGNPKNIIKKGPHGKAVKIKKTSGYTGKPGTAIQFSPGTGMDFSKIDIPLDISADTFPEITITFWIKASENYKNLQPFMAGGSKGRSLLTRISGGMQHWCASGGKEDKIIGPAVLKDKWTFIALVYDYPNRQARLIVNDEVSAGRASTGTNLQHISLGNFKGVMDDLLIFGRILSLEEIEHISGIPVAKNREGYSINDRSAYREKRRLSRLSGIQEGEVYILARSEMAVRDSVRSPNTLHIFSEGDTIFITGTAKDDWFKVKNHKGEEGFVSGKTIKSSAYRTGDFKLIFRFLNWLSHIFMINRIGNWIAVAIFLLILYFAVKFRNRLNDWFSRFGGISETEAFASKGSSGRPGIRMPGIFTRNFPLQRPALWMILPGLLFGIMIMGGSLWDSYELEWYFSEGANIIPAGFTHPMHWVLWSLSLIIIVLIITLFLESLTIAGPWPGLFRFIMLAVLNVMAVVVSLYLLIGFVVVIFGLLLLFFPHSSSFRQ